MRIRYLPETLINQIAAGEVIERPAAAVKELVENAIDAGSTKIDIHIRDGGKSRIVISDDGFGMNAKELAAAVDRHATSKLPDDDLLDIQHLGFRGEALASIAAISRLKIETREQKCDGWQISIEGGKKTDIIPSAHPKGTKIEIKDLFYATPARLKFMKSERAEFLAVKDVITRLAMAFPHIGFTLKHNEKNSLTLPATMEPQARLSSILGKEFGQNSMHIETHRDDVHLHGFAGLPTLDRGTAQYQYLFVNGRPVKDKLITGCVRAAYADVLHRGRHPMVVLFLELPSQHVDVNVHPAKTEVRFQDPNMIRGLIITALKNALMEGGFRTSSTASSAMLGAMRPATPPPSHRIMPSLPMHRGSAPAVPSSYSNLAEAPTHNYQHHYSESLLTQEAATPSARFEPTAMNAQEQSYETEHMLGAARAQIHENYIIAQTANGMVVVDQHAAHERLVYERFKTQMKEQGIEKQGLLSPEIIDLSPEDALTVLEMKDQLSRMGLDIEPFGNGAIAVQSVPAILGSRVNIPSLIQDIIDGLHENKSIDNLKEKINDVISRMSCHSSVRSGRRMNADEMNALLREMERTPLSGQCNHGRPTYISLELKDIEKLFGRR